MWASPCWPYGHMGHPLPLLRQVRTPHRAELGHWKGHTAIHLLTRRYGQHAYTAIVSEQAKQAGSHQCSVGHEAPTPTDARLGW